MFLLDPQTSYESAVFAAGAAVGVCGAERAAKVKSDHLIRSRTSCSPPACLSARQRSLKALGATVLSSPSCCSPTSAHWRLPTSRTAPSTREILRVGLEQTSMECAQLDQRQAQGDPQNHNRKLFKTRKCDSLKGHSFLFCSVACQWRIFALPLSLGKNEKNWAGDNFKASVAATAG